MVYSRIYACTFNPGGWAAKDWLQVRSPRWNHSGGWIQRGDHISNCVPAGATAEEMLGPRAGETYSSMVFANSLSGQVRVRTTASFDFRMAPSIVLAGPLGADEDGHPEYREHVEIVLFDEGVNIWHHTWVDGVPVWGRAAWWRFDLVAGESLLLEAVRCGPELQLDVAGRSFGCRIEELPAEMRFGITGCEGINRFYDFEVYSLAE